MSGQAQPPKATLIGVAEAAYLVYAALQDALRKSPNDAARRSVLQLSRTFVDEQSESLEGTTPKGSAL